MTRIIASMKPRIGYLDIIKYLIKKFFKKIFKIKE